jgi:hypothetical protein
LTETAHLPIAIARPGNWPYRPAARSHARIRLIGCNRGFPCNGAPSADHGLVRSPLNEKKYHLLGMT